MSNDMKPFVWADGVNANVKEPIQALREHGWRYGDVPAASNFNWMFKTIGEELDAQKTMFLKKLEDLSEKLVKQKDTLERQKTLISQALSSVQGMHRQQNDVNEAIRHLIAVTVQLVSAVNNGVPTVFHPGYPFKSKGDGKLPEPIRDIRLNTVCGEED